MNDPSQSILGDPVALAAGDHWPRGWGEPQISASMRASPADFRVDEILDIPIEGDGEFDLVQVRKTGHNTQWLAEQLARHAGVRHNAVSYAGRKDRNAVTTQWFSVHLPGRPPADWGRLELPGVEVLTVHRHARKLRRGAHSGNRFRLILRDPDGSFESLLPRLERLRAGGVPNYFGTQRFGHGANNLSRALDHYRRTAASSPGDRRSRGRRRGGHDLLHSAARSLLFNHVLALRVINGDWRQALDGDVWMFEDGHTHFGPEPVDAAIRQRVEALEILPTGPLWGRGEPAVQGVVAAMERQVAEDLSEFARGLEAAGLKAARRTLVSRVHDLQWDLSSDRLEVAFWLRPGNFATSVIRELIDARR